MVMFGVHVMRRNMGEKIKLIEEEGRKIKLVKSKIRRAIVLLLIFFILFGGW